MLQKYFIKISAQFEVGRAELKYKVTDTILRVYGRFYELGTYLVCESESFFKNKQLCGSDTVGSRKFWPGRIRNNSRNQIRIWPFLQEKIV